MRRGSNIGSILIPYLRKLIVDPVRKITLGSPPGVKDGVVG